MSLRGLLRIAAVQSPLRVIAIASLNSHRTHDQPPTQMVLVNTQLAMKYSTVVLREPNADRC